MTSARHRLRPGRQRRTAAIAACVALTAVASACSGFGAAGDSEPSSPDVTTTPLLGAPATPPLPPALALLVGSPSPFATGTDNWAVWVCHVPATTTADLYDADPWRLRSSPDDLATLFAGQVTGWFDHLSHGAYRPAFVGGGEVRVDAEGAGEECVDAALAAARAAPSPPAADGLLVVADAEHRPDAPGGWGRPGTCDTPCTRRPAADTGRAVYIGASDFSPAWDGRPPLDLVEHEIGHALDLPHSAVLLEGQNRTYESAIDVMSDSAGPRQVDPDRRDGPDTLAANRLSLGWLTPADAAVVTEPTEVTLLPSTSAAPGTRVAVIPLDDERLLTVELLDNRDDDGHLAAPGVAVHLVDQTAAACSTDEAELDPCTGEHRAQTPQFGTMPYTDLLGAGEETTTNGWTIHVLSVERGSDGVVSASVAMWR